MNGHLDKVIQQLILVLPKMSGYVETFKSKDKNNKLMSFHIKDNNFLEKYKAIWIKVNDWKNVALNALPVYDDKYIKNNNMLWQNLY